MKYCSSWKQLKIERIVAWIGLWVLAIWWLALAFMPVKGAGVFSILFSILCTLLAFLCIAVCIVKDIIEWRKYSVDEKGIKVYYCNQYVKFYPWSMFSRLIVCDICHAGKTPSVCHFVIRLAADDEECGPLSEKRQYARPHIDRWRGAWYTFVRFRKIICITFSPERLEEIQQLSKLPVIYSLTIYGRETYKTKQETGQWDR